MSERTEKSAVADLLSAIVAALDVPLPSLAATDERAYLRLLERRTGDVRIVVAYAEDRWEAASEIRRRTAEAPVTYTPFEFTADGASR
ncbi:hypothetical protein OTB20_00965 [Streptomyces sp. H27-H1]|uniref:hypothetical protein n=1 Tax=Streptomyces sp. H27-H1 TaxID=2996461 RepID=UPI00227223E8|nr:hypothetical protein [Streptomyces sp. H27-H1]MCY0924810.1 hypothetical protein [Streptomyces sp. H27-H1]